MATATSQLLVQDYLRATLDPDCEFVEGALEERQVRESNQAAWQDALLDWLRYFELPNSSFSVPHG